LLLLSHFYFGYFFLFLKITNNQSFQNNNTNNDNNNKNNNNNNNTITKTLTITININYGKMAKAQNVAEIVALLGNKEDEVCCECKAGLEGANKVSLEWVLKKIQEKKEMFETAVKAIQATRTQQNKQISTNKLNK